MAGMMVGGRGWRTVNCCAAGACLASGCTVAVRGAADRSKMNVWARCTFYAVWMSVERMWFHGYGTVEIGFRHYCSDVALCRSVMPYRNGRSVNARERTRVGLAVSTPISIY